AASLLHANVARTRALERRGARVLSGRESMGPLGESIVTLVVGLPGRPTHRVLLVRGGMPAGEDSPRVSRLAVVLYGFGDDEALASQFLALPVPFAVALPPGAKSSAPLFKAAHDRRREVVLHLPLEPINYPQVNPGPGTILVTMKPTQIGGLMRRYLERAGPVAAVANHMGSLATQDMTVMSAVYRELHRQRVPFLHMTPAAGAVCKPLASELGVSYEEPDAVIDYEARSPKPVLLDRRWRDVLSETRTRGHTV